MLYESLLADSTKVGYTSTMSLYRDGVCVKCFIIGRTQFQPNTVIKGLDKMREKELLELLCQYESEEKFNCIPTASDWFEVRTALDQSSLLAVSVESWIILTICSTIIIL